jgi:hypothetical protein
MDITELMSLPNMFMLTRASTTSFLVLHCNYLGVMILVGVENLRTYYQSKAHQRIVPLVSKNVINAFVVQGSGRICRVVIPSTLQHFGNLTVNSPVSNLECLEVRLIGAASSQPQHSVKASRGWTSHYPKCEPNP